MGNLGGDEWKTLTLVKDMIFSLGGKGSQQTAKELLKIFDANHPNSFNLIIIQMLLYLYIIKMNDSLIFDIYLDFIKTYYDLLKENNYGEFSILKYFMEFIKEFKYLFSNYIPSSINISNSLNNIILDYNYIFFQKIENNIFKNIYLIQRNSSNITKVIQNDNVEELQILSSQTNFNYNQILNLPINEASYFNEYETDEINVTLIDYAAFFGSVKCFKYLLLNGSNVNTTAKYAVAGGNEEIIHLCEQNHSSFEGSLEIAIEYHRNEIFKYLYENKVVEILNISKLGNKCIIYHNYEILSYLIEEGMGINDYIINKSAKKGNFYLTKHFLQVKHIPENILIYAVKSVNMELIEYILYIIEQKEIDINACDIYVIYLK